jgi:CheY-like chemotaxis protein
MAPDRAMDPWNVIFVEDDESLQRTTKERIESLAPFEGIPFRCTTFESFEPALEAIPLARPDVLILDVFRGHPTPEADRPGLAILERVKHVAFVPVILYTAAEQLVSGERAPFVRVVGKSTTGFELLEREIRQFLAWKIPQLNRALRRTFDDTLRDYLWGTVQERWETFKDLVPRPDFGRLVVQRLSEEFADVAAAGVVSMVYGSEHAPSIPADTVHPSSYYVIPGSGPSPRFGEIRRRGSAADPGGYLVVLQPTCDMVIRPGDGRNPPGPPNVERVLCASTVACGSHKDQHSFHLPHFLDLPSMDVEFQKLELLLVPDVAGLPQVGRLASPFAESLSARFAAFIGRVGVPDLHPGLS